MPRLHAGEIYRARLGEFPYQISGFAWSGGGAIRRLEVSTDGGRTWKDAQLQEPVFRKALTRFRVDWNWNGEEAVLQSRATDELGNVQPTLAEFSQKQGVNVEHWLTNGLPTHVNPIHSWKITHSSNRSGRLRRGTGADSYLWLGPGSERGRNPCLGHRDQSCRNRTSTGERNRQRRGQDLCAKVRRLSRGHRDRGSSESSGGRQRLAPDCGVPVCNTAMGYYQPLHASG